MPDIQKAVAFIRGVAADDSHGYDQAHRNGPDYDCSSLVATALHEAGFNIRPTSYTGNLRQQLVDCGFCPCSAPWIAGDIHLTEYRHVCMSVSSTKIVEASINEKGGITGGQSGDQTGREIWEHDYYSFPWQYHYRYVAPAANVNDLNVIAKEVIAGKWGNGEARKNALHAHGFDYQKVQNLVNAILNGEEPEDPKADINEIAREVILGRWGNGSERRERLERAGYNYSEVQKLVNAILG